MSQHHAAIKNDPRYHAWRGSVIKRAGYRCEDCGAEEDLTADHVVALANGGAPFDPDNGRCLCRPCNSRKGDRALTRANYVNTKYLADL